MKKLVFFLMLCCNLCYGQKPTLSLDCYKTWPEVVGGGISNNGKYAFYTVKNYPVAQNTFYLKTTAGEEIMSTLGVSRPTFSNDSRYLIGQLPGDSLLVYDLKHSLRRIIQAVKSYELQNVGKQELLVLKTAKGLQLSELSGTVLQTLDQVKLYKFSPNGRAMVFVQADSCIKGRVIAWWLGLSAGKPKLIYKGPPLRNIIFDAPGNQIAFIVNVSGSNSIYYYREHDSIAQLLVDNQTAGIENGLSIETGQYWSFSKDGERIFFSLKSGPKQKRQHEIPGLEIWSYQDAYLRSYYDGNYYGLQSNIVPKQYLSVVSLPSRSIRQLITGNQVMISGSLKFDTDSIFIAEASGGLSSEDWNPMARGSYFLCYTKTGKQLLLEKDRMPQISKWNVSPTGKYIAYYDPTGKYICYDIINQKKRVITELMGKSIFGYQSRDFALAKYPVSISGWLPKDEGLIINTTFDIWQVDPKGVLLPKNLTRGEGERTKTVFFLAKEKIGGKIGGDGTMILSAFDTQTKNYGFYRLHLKGQTNLEKLSFAARYSSIINGLYFQLFSSDFIASDNGYLIRWQGFDQAPNYFYSKDLKTFTPLSDVQPQKAYNWLKAELVTYRDSLGNQYQGILYKPENFNPAKRYPVVFNYYENRSNELNRFIAPELFSGADFTVSLLVSNGYLVFKPDIHGSVEAPGEGALRSVLAAADHLTALPFVNEKKMAITGHSYGGFQTNYIITHTNRFAAAVSGAGVSSMIAAATDLWGYGGDKQLFYQSGTIMLNRTLTAAPEVYIRNSPILQAGMLSTPILFLHNENDQNVPVHHTRSFFMVLRSLQKTCWWLNYKKEGHGINEDQNKLDFTKKMWGFLDYFLKDTPEPEWMKEHI